MTANLRTAMALSALVMVTYVGSLGGSFHYDDFHSLVHNPAVRGLGNVPAFFDDPSRPLLMPPHDISDITT